MSILYGRCISYPESILIRYFEGKVDVNDIIDSWEYLKKEKLIDEKIKGVINNISNCELNLNMESFTKLIGYLKEQEFLNGVRLAVIVNNPDTIVFPIIGERQNNGLEIKAFSTVEASIKWIMS